MGESRICSGESGRIRRIPATVARLISSMFFLGLFALPKITRAEFFIPIYEKQEKKKPTRWSLQDWLETKDRSMLMDLWLKVNSPTPYEFYLSTDYNLRSPLNSSTPFDASGLTGYRANFGAFASIFGAEIERDSILSRWHLLFKLRLMGFHNQGTNLTAFGGLRMQSDPFPFNSPVVGGSFLLYLAQFFGVEGQFRTYFPSRTPGSAYSFRGQQMELYGFIDFNFLRIYSGYLRYFDDYMDQMGYYLGTKIFF